MIRTIHIVLLLVSLVLSANTYAKKPRFSKRFKEFRLEAGAEMPLQIMGKLKADYLEKWYVSAGLGYSPRTFLDIYSSVSGAIGFTGQKTANLVRDSISGSFILDLRVGKHPERKSGLFYEGGYQFISGGGGSTTVSDIEGVTGLGYTSVPVSSLDSSSSVEVKSSVHAATFSTGYKYSWKDYELMGAVGVVKPLIGNTTINFTRITGTSNAGQQASDLKSKGQSKLDEAFLAKVFIPTFTIVVVKRF